MDHKALSGYMMDVINILNHIMCGGAKTLNNKDVPMLKPVAEIYDPYFYTQKMR